MGFYEQISRYYDYIFPAGKEQLDFLRNVSGEPGRKILDVACGSGEYSVGLAKSGYEVMGTDIEGKMVEKAKEKARCEGLDIDFFRCDMRELDSTISKKFDSVFCIGNSIVHLGNTDEITKALKAMGKVLYSNGTLVLQIINYDRVLKYRLSELPPIKNEEPDLLFERRYEYDDESGLVNFHTVLSVYEDGVREVMENSIKLFPVLSGDMHKSLSDAGFGSIEVFGDFSCSPYDKDHSFMLVIKAVKS